MFKLKGSNIILAVIGIGGVLVFFIAMSLGMSALFFDIAKFSTHAAVILYAYQAMAMSVLLLLQVIPTVSVDLFDESSYYKYFLFLPIHRGALILTTFLTSITGAMFPLLLLLPSTAGYLIVLHSVGAIWGVISFGIFLCGLTLWGAIVGTRLMQTPILRKMGRYAMIFNLLIFVAYWNLFPRFTSQIGDGATSPLINLYYKIQHLDTGFPLFWIFSSAIEGNIITSLLLCVIGIILFRAGWRIANTLSFEVPFQLKSKPRRTISVKFWKKLWKYPTLEKDFLAFRRDAENYLLLVYPLFFAIVMSLGSGKNFIQAFVIAIVMASNGCMMTSVKLLAEDTRNSRLFCTYPIDLRNTILMRAIFMSLIWTTVVIITGLLYISIFHLIYPIYLSIIPVLLVLFGNSLIAQKIWLGKAKTSQVTPKSALGLYALVYSLGPAFIGILPIIAGKVAKLTELNVNILISIMVIISYSFSFIYVFLSKLLIREKRIVRYFENI
ncbi:hypothetical protein J7L68_06785 [bacterium]|nr:hypothetical protein [bacterium]